MKNIVFYLFIILLLTFNIYDVESNSDKAVLYDNNNLYYQDNYILYLRNINSIELDKILNKYDINITKYIIDDKEYYAKNIDELIEIYSENMSFDDKTYYELNGIKVDAIEGLIDNYKVLSLEKERIIY